jgi:hypothetical protein
MKIEAKEFMAVMDVANRRYQAAVRRFLRIQKRGTPAQGFAHFNGELDLATKKLTEQRDEIVWLVGGLLSPGTGTWARLARMTATELLKKPKGRLRCKRQRRSRIRTSGSR